MSVDKFGRHVGRAHAIKDPKGEGFNLTPEGDYDIKSKKLRNLKGPTDRKGAVTLRYMNIHCMRMHVKNYTFDGRYIRITALKDPKDYFDAVNKLYVEKQVPKKGDDSYHFNNYRLKGVVEPVDKDDAVN